MEYTILALALLAAISCTCFACERASHFELIVALGTVVPFTGTVAYWAMVLVTWLDGGAVERLLWL